MINIHKTQVIPRLAALSCLLWLLAGAGPPGGAIPLVLVQLGGASLVAESPLTSAQKYKGLGGRDGLAPGRGMLFILDSPAGITMSMRGMRFALDFIWCRGGRVVGITAQVPAGGKTRLLHSKGKVSLVLEAPAGWAQASGIKVGDPVRLKALSQPTPPALERLLDRLTVIETATE